MDISAVATLRERVEQSIAGSAPVIVNKVIAKFVDEEIDRRAGLVVQGITRLRQLETDFAKTNKPDQVFYDAAGVETQSTYTKGKLDAINKAKKEVTKLSEALDKAINSGDYKGLEETLKKGGKPDAKTDDAAE